MRLRDLGVQFAWIEPGTFRMGNSPTQEEHLRSQQMWDDRSKAEQPVREMVVKEGFYLGKYAITQAQWLGGDCGERAIFSNNSRCFFA